MLRDQGNRARPGGGLLLLSWLPGVDGMVITSSGAVLSPSQVTLALEDGTLLKTQGYACAFPEYRKTAWCVTPLQGSKTRWTVTEWVSGTLVGSIAERTPEAAYERAKVLLSRTSEARIQRIIELTARRVAGMSAGLDRREIDKEFRRETTRQWKERRAA